MEGPIENLLYEICYDLSIENKYKAEVKFRQLPAEYDQQRFVLTLSINEEVIFEEKALVSKEIRPTPVNAIKQQLVHRMLRSVMEAGISKGIEWYQKKMQYGRSD